MTRVPLLDSAGTVRGHAAVDPSDFEAVSSRTWRRHGSGYAVRYGKTRQPDRRTVAIFMHREILGLQRGDGLEVDHINGDKFDNRQANLRVCTRAENGQNVARFPQGRTSRYRGVSRQRGRQWRASVRLAGKLHQVGAFEDEREAALAAQAFRDEHMPFALPDPALWPLDREPESERDAA